MFVLCFLVWNEGEQRSCGGADGVELSSVSTDSGQQRTERGTDCEGGQPDQGRDER